MHFSLFHATGSLPTTFTWEFWAIQCLHIQHSVTVSCTINRILFYVFCTVHCDIIMQHEPMKCALSKLLLWFNFWYLLHVSNCPENEPLKFETYRRRQKLNWSINLKSVHFSGSMLHKNILTLWPKKTDILPVWSQSAYCLMIVEKAHAPQIWP